MRNEYIAYKVCSVRDDGKFKSCVIKSDLELEYREHYTTFPEFPEARILVFETLEDARDFANRNTAWASNEYVLFKGIAVGAHKMNIARHDGVYKDNLEMLLIVWNSPIQSFPPSPIGTLACDSFTPIEIIERGELER